MDSFPLCYGLQRLDHAVGNTDNLLEAVNYIAGFTGFHEFAEFTAADVGTVDSGLNSMVLANNNEYVLLPVNEPTFGTKRYVWLSGVHRVCTRVAPRMGAPSLITHHSKSQIQTYLEQNEGPGLQHLALKTDDIVTTMREMRQRSACGGFEFMPRASDEYYRKLPDKIGDALTPQQYEEIEQLGILADKDDQVCESAMWCIVYIATALVFTHTTTAGGVAADFHAPCGRPPHYIPRNHSARGLRASCCWGCIAHGTDWRLWGLWQGQL